MENTQGKSNMDTDDGMEPRNDKTTGTIGNGRELAKKTRMDGMGDTKRFKHRLDIIIGHFNWQV